MIKPRCHICNKDLLGGCEELIKVNLEKELIDLNLILETLKTALELEKSLEIEFAERKERLNELFKIYDFVDTNEDWEDEVLPKEVKNELNKFNKIKVKQSEFYKTEEGKKLVATKNEKGIVENKLVKFEDPLMKDQVEYHAHDPRDLHRDIETYAHKDCFDLVKKTFPVFDQPVQDYDTFKYKIIVDGKVVEKTPKEFTVLNNLSYLKSYTELLAKMKSDLKDAKEIKTIENKIAEITLENKNLIK